MDWGESERIDVEVGWEWCDMPLYLRIKMKEILPVSNVTQITKTYGNGVE